MGTYQDTSFDTHGFVRSPQGFYTTLDPPQSVETLVYGINAEGAITGSYYTVLGPVQTPNHGFVRTPQGTITPFDVPGSLQTYPAGINNAGVITGQYVDFDGSFFRNHGFVRDTQGNIEPIDFPGSIYTVATAINNHGAIVGSYSLDSVTTFGFLRLPAADGESKGKD